MMRLPKTATIVGRAPGLFRKAIERVGFRGDTIARALALASR